MSEQQTPGFDLSSLPPAVRARVEQALARLPAEQRRQFEQHGSPMLQKLVARLSQTAGNHDMGHPPPLPTAASVANAAKKVITARITPHGHYNQTIRPGDRGQTLVRLAMLAVVAAIAWTFWP